MTEIPLWIKIAYTLVVCVLVPIYLRYYGLPNFLWFSDIALLVTMCALWLESRLLASMMALGVMLPELAWSVDFFVHLVSGRSLLGLASYMFDPEKPLMLRALSLFHVALPVVLLLLVWRLGYEPRAWWPQVIVGETVLLLTYALTDPRANINWVFGPGAQPQRRIPPPLYLAMVMAFFPAFIYWPTHLALRWLFPGPG